jgi:hypothetical protein
MSGKRITQVIMCLFAITTMIFTMSTSATSEEIDTSVEHEAGFYYTIQKGDTLWDLSDNFFDTPWFWPELWQENDQIPNPHWIYPGERIRLFQKKGTDIFTLKRPEDESLTQESAAETEMEAETETEPAQASKEDTLYYLYPSIDAIGFIRKEPVKPIGFIMKVQDEKTLINQGDTIYINYADKENSPVMQGSRYAVYRKIDPTKDRKQNRMLGGQYYVLGIVEVLTMEDNFFTARVVKSYRSIQINDFLLPYMVRSPKIPIAESVEGLEGKIIISEDHREIIGDFTVVFIDKGKEDNVGPGQIYSIFYQEKGPLTVGGKKSAAFSRVDYGKLVVLHSENHTSTVLVTKTQQHAFPGALIRTPVD